jgi:hypothetical protein
MTATNEFGANHRIRGPFDPVLFPTTGFGLVQRHKTSPPATSSGQKGKLVLASSQYPSTEFSRASTGTSPGDE